MLPRAERLKRSHLFAKAYSARKSINTPFFTLYVLPRINKFGKNSLDGRKELSDKKLLPMTGFVVSKKTSKSSYQRNRIKRRTREAYGKLRGPELSQWYAIIIVIKESVLKASWTDLCRTMESALIEVAHRYGRNPGKSQST